jgi:hypothetical protein
MVSGLLGGDCCVLSANDIAESQPGEQFVGGGVCQVQRLVSAWGAVVKLQRVDRIQS